jgi:hypothetical protein
MNSPIITERELHHLGHARSKALAAFEAYHDHLGKVIAARRPRWRTVPWVQDYELTVCCVRSPLPRGLEQWMHPDGFYVWGGFQFHPAVAKAEFQTGLGLNSAVLKLSERTKKLLQKRIVASASLQGLVPPEAAWEPNPERPMWSYLTGPGPDEWSYRLGDWKTFTTAVAERLFAWADLTAPLVAARL